MAGEDRLACSPERSKIPAQQAAEGVVATVAAPENARPGGGEKDKADKKQDRQTRSCQPGPAHRRQQIRLRFRLREFQRHVPVSGAGLRLARTIMPGGA